MEKEFSHVSFNLTLFGGSSGKPLETSPQIEERLTNVQSANHWERTNSSKDFSTIRQGTSTNALTKLRASEGKGLQVDSVTGEATIKRGNFILSIPNYTQLAGLKTSTFQLLDACIIELTETGAKSPTIKIPLEKYMERRGLKDRKEAKSQAKSDLEILSGARFCSEEKKGKHTESYSFINIADSGEIKRNGDIVFIFGATFYKILLSYRIMPYPDLLQTINNKKYPNSYYLLRKISEHKNMNIGKPNEDIIAVKTLLNIAPYIPSYKEVINGNRNISERIIEPFERDLNALEERLTWEYCHSLKQPLTDDELQNNMSYSLFESLFICIHWKDYPDQTARLEKIATRKALAEAKKQASSKKKSSTRK